MYWKHAPEGVRGNPLLWAWGGGLHSDVEGHTLRRHIDPPEGVAKFKGVLLREFSKANRKVPPVSSYDPNLDLLATRPAGAKWGVVW